MTGGFATIVALLVCTALGAVAGFVVARLHAGKNAEEGAARIGGAGEAGPVDAADERAVAAPPDDRSASEVRRRTAMPTTAAGSTPVAAPVLEAPVFASELTDAEIDALDAELPAARRRRHRRPPPPRNFDRL